MRRYYEVLGISEDADEAEIKKGYRRKASDTHPDTHPDDPEAAAKFKEVKEAYECLSDPERKLAYDETGDTSVETGNPAEDLFIHLLNEVVDDHETVFDTLARVKHVLTQMIDECMERKFQTDVDIVKLTGRVKRVRYDGKGVNLVEAVIKDKLVRANQLRSELDDAMTAAKGAYDMMKDYLATDKPARKTNVEPSEKEQKFLREMGMLQNLMNGPTRRRRGGFPGTGV